MELTLADYHPRLEDPAVILALVLSALVVVVGGFFIFRPVVRGTRFTARLLAVQVVALVAVVLSARLLASFVVRVYYIVSHNPNAGIVCAHWVQRNPLPYVLALPLISVLLLLSRRRSQKGNRALHPQAG